MAELRRAEGQIELKCDADKFFDVWACKPRLISKLCPNKVPKIELVEGEWDKVGAVIDWTYLFDGNTESAKVRIEELDIENRKLRYMNLDGFLLKNYYKTFGTTIQVVPKDEGCIAKWCFEYEKMNESVPEPNMYIDYTLDVAKVFDAIYANLKSD